MTYLLHPVKGKLTRWRGDKPPEPSGSRLLVRSMKARMDQVIDPDAPMERPTGPGVYAIEDLGVNNDFIAAATKVAGLAAGPDGRRVLTLPPGIWEANSFSMSENYIGFLVPPGVSIVGSGPKHTIFRVKKDSITQAQVDKWYPKMDTYPAVILLRTMHFYNSNNLLLAQFAVEGLQQRVGGTGVPAPEFDTYHYSGIAMSRLTNSTIRDVKVFGIPGYRNSPPGETSHFGTLRCSGLKFIRCEADGRDRNGVKRGSAGIAPNTSSDLYFEDCYSHHMYCSHGFAFWETNGISLLRCGSDYNGATSASGGSALGGIVGDGFNFERSRNSLMQDCWTGYNTLTELRYYARNDGNEYDGDTFPHEIRNLRVTDGGPLDIRIDNLQRTLPVLSGSPSPTYSLNPKGQA